MIYETKNPSEFDTYVTLGLRKRMIKALREKGIKSEKVLYWMSMVPRHLFLASIFERYAYELKAMPIFCKQTISSPYTVAYQTEWLELESNHKVLEIGTGSGYQCAVLCAAGTEVYSIEYIRELHEEACKLLFKKLNLRPHLYCGDGSAGLSEEAPFDRIIVTAGAPLVPEQLFNQLKVGGILVIPVGVQKEQKMVKYRKISEQKAEVEKSHSFTFVPLKGQNGWE